MTVTMHQRFPRERWDSEIRRLLLQELRQRKRLLFKSSGILIIGEKIDQLVAENGDTARLEPYHRHTVADLFPQRIEDLAQQCFRLVEHSIVIQRPATTKRCPRHHDTET